MRTADSIEEGKAQQKSSEQRIDQRTTKKAEQLIKFRWVKGQSGNPGGRPKSDFAAGFARRIMEARDNEQLLEKYATGFARQLAKGNAYTFKELAERGYGKLKEVHENHNIYTDDSDESLRERIAQLERDLGLAGQIDEAGRAGHEAARASKTNGKAEATDILPK